MREKIEIKLEDKYFDWTVKAYKEYGVICECKCGKLQWIAKNKLVKGRSKCCRTCSNRAQSESNKKHGFGVRKNRPRIYNIWGGMMARCYNPKGAGYRSYGGRGIKVCKRWHQFENFLADMGEPPLNHYIDRINCDGDYEPDNCRWIHEVDSAKNTRHCRYYLVKGCKMTQKDAAHAIKTTSATLGKWANRLGLQEALSFLQKNPWRERNKQKNKNAPLSA